MAEYIERDEILKYPIRINHYDKEHGNEDFVLGIESVIEYVKYIPAADVEPVRRGHWIINSDGYYPQCSECMSEPQGRVMTDWCPNCGARMDGEE